MKITVDVVSDVICPWCLVGKRRLEKAIATLQGTHEILVRWYPFQLNPAMPQEGVSRHEYRIKKFGSLERSQELDANLIAVGKTEGISFDFERMTRTPNTVDAHRLVWLAGKQDCQDAVMEALFIAYFTEGKNLSDQQTLLEVVTEAGLDRQQAEALLNSDEGMEAIKDGEALSRQHRVNGVPFFIINNEMTLSGAQPPETFVQAFRLAAAR